ncbi:MAG: hypothetical protein NT125_07005 [Candidatus Bipolaricaulota bacterium]|nr:hypothetical protein [Candidatus Bipolaricaulota bacterium]
MSLRVKKREAVVAASLIHGAKDSVFREDERAGEQRLPVPEPEFLPNLAVQSARILVVDSPRRVRDLLAKSPTQVYPPRARQRTINRLHAVDHVVRLEDRPQPNDESLVDPVTSSSVAALEGVQLLVHGRKMVERQHYLRISRLRL